MPTDTFANTYLDTYGVPDLTAGDDLPNGSFELNGVLFGEGGDIVVESFDPGSAEWRSQDAMSSTSDVRFFGRDRRAAPSWSWDLTVSREDEETGLETLDALAAAWDNDDVAATPGEVSALRYRVAGRTRRVYGRPRRFAPVLDVRRYAGVIPVTCDFTRSDPLHYDDVEQQLTMGLMPATVGGLVSPLVSPLTSLDTSGQTRTGQVVVGGSATTPLTISFIGDVTNPSLELVGHWKVSIAGSVASGDTITIDARPWKLSVTRANGGSAANLLRGSRLSELRIPPGQQELVYRGSSASGTSLCAVRWRAASKTL